MKRFALVFFLALVSATFSNLALAQLPELKPLKGTPSPSKPKHPDKFVFILAGDNRPDKFSDPQGHVVKAIFKAIHKEKPAFVLWTGDIISGKKPSEPKTITKQYEEFLVIAATGDAGLFNAPGNHELNDGDNCPNDTMLKLYLDDTDQAHPYGSFDYGDSHFIALDSDEAAPTGDPCNCSSSGDKPPGYISAAQMALLGQDLEVNKTKAHIFIFAHRPLVGYKGEDQLCPANVTEIQAMFQKYPTVSYVVAGHQHMYYNPQGPEFGPPPVRTDPGKAPYYLVSGGAGAPLKKKGFFHYLVFTVDKATVSVQVEPVDQSEDPN